MVQYECNRNKELCLQPELHHAYDAWVAHRLANDPLVERLVVETEATCNLDDLQGREGIVRRYPEVPFTARVWHVFFANTLRLSGVKRIDRRPYATHPTRMAMSCYWFAGAAAPAGAGAADDAATAALLHDYLEESGGISAASYADLRRRLPGEALATAAAVLLSEPEIAYERLGRASELSIMRRVAYVVQASDALARGAPSALADAALVDKLDNLHDLGYLDKEPDPARRARKLAQRIAFFELVAERIGPFGDPLVWSMLKAGIVAHIVALGLDGVVQGERAVLRGRLVEAEAQIRAMTQEYHRRIGVELVS